MKTISTLNLLSSKPIDFSAGEIHPITMGDVRDMGGEFVFNKLLSSILITKEDIMKMNEGSQDDMEDLEDITDFDIVFLMCTQDELFSEMVISFLEDYLFRTSVTLGNNSILIGKDNKPLDSTNYRDFINIVKTQNCLLKPSDDALGDNPNSDKAEELLAKRQKAREKVNQLKNNGEGSDSPLELSDLISILCSNGNGIDIFNVWDLSFYAFNDQFSRMKMFDDYQVNVQSLLAGADPKEIEMKHWMSKIE